MKLPDVSGLTVAYDTEGSGLFVDDGARISAVSCAWRDPRTGQLRAFSAPFDQGVLDLPLGAKTLAANHAKRVAKWQKEHGDGILMAPNKTPEAWVHLHRWLLRQHLIMHHKKYDCLMADAGLRAEWNSSLHLETRLDLMPLVMADTQLRQKVLDPDQSSSLKPTSVRLHLGAALGMPEGSEAAEQEKLAPWKGPQADPRYDLIPWSVLGPYARLDAIETLLLFEHQEKRLQDEDDPQVQLYRRLIARQEQLSRVLYGMERRGVGFDKEGCLAEDAKLRKLETEARAAVPFRPTQPGAKKYFFGPPPEGLGHIPYSDKMTATGAPQTDEDVVERLVREQVPGAREFQILMSLQSARSKWYSAWPDLVGPDGRIRTCHRQGHVVSSRLSVERWQAQAMPHDYQIPEGIIPIRFFLTGDPETCRFEVDVSQAEIRVATRLSVPLDELSRHPMYRAIRRGIDSHDAATKLMFYPSTPLAEAKASHDWSKYRDVSKRCNLGILYGGGMGAIHSAILKFTGMDYDKDLVRDWIQDWRRAFPPFVRALDNRAELASRQGWIRLVDGSRRYFSDWEPVHKAFNQEVQGSVAVAVEMAMIEFDRRHPGSLLLQVHDSLVGECALDEYDEVSTDLAAILKNTFERLFRPVPFAVDIKPFGRDAYAEEFSNAQ